VTSGTQSIQRLLIADPEGLLGQNWMTKLAEDPTLLKMQMRIEFQLATGFEEVLSYLRAGQFSTFVLGTQSPAEWLESVVLAKKISPSTSIIVVSEEWPPDILREFVNRGRIQRPLLWQKDWTELGLQLAEAMLEGEISRTQEVLLNESRQQNRELQILTDHLEEIVRDRTLSIEASREDIVENLNRARNLTRFTQGVARQSSFEEIMTLVRREFRHFQRLGDPILLLKLEEEVLDVLSFRVGQLQESRFKKNVELPTAQNFSSRELSTILANLLGRPFHRLLSFPLEVALIRKFGFERASAVLCFESQMDEPEINEFLLSFQQILKPITIAVDRLFLERELTLESFRWERTFDGLRDPIAVIDKERQVLRSNNKFSARQLHKSCFQAFAGRNEPCPGCPVEQALQSGEPSSSQVEIRGRHFVVQSYPIQLLDSQSFSSVVNQYSDVTPSKEIYARMLQSEKMSAIGNLAAHIAHELNNPLTGIQSLTQILKSEAEGQSDPTSKQIFADLGEIEKAAKRSQIIIKNLLEFTGEGDHEIQRVSIEEVWTRTLPLLKTLLGNHRWKARFLFSEHLTKVDPHLLQQVIFNIVNNAAQAMGPKGELELADLYFPDTQEVGMSIRDTGSGIPLEIREKIFEPFFTTKEESRGTGLGLSLSREILRKFGGDLKLHASSDAGSEFWILLPIDNSATEKGIHEGSHH
jgi:signal transduction histidine kinase